MKQELLDELSAAKAEVEAAADAMDKNQEEYRACNQRLHAAHERYEKALTAVAEAA